MENSLMMLKIIRLETIAILLVGIEQLLIKHAISCIENLIAHISGYNSHLFVKNLGCSEGNIDCIPNNEKRYISFSKKYRLGVILRKSKMRKEKLRTKLNLYTIK